MPRPDAAERQPEAVRQMFARVARRYDLANRALSLGLDPLWRRRTARAVAADRPQRILDVATGTGDLALCLRRHCPGASVLGADFCRPMLDLSLAKGSTPVVVADGMRLPHREATFDALTVAFGLRNMPDWAAALREFLRVLRPGGFLAVLDFSMPPGLLGTCHRLYLRHALPRLADLLTGERGAYRYLGESIELFPSGPAMLALLRDAGYAEPAAAPLTGGIVTLYTARRPR